MRAYWNTKKQGSLRFIIFKEGREYCAVCLELDIVEHGDRPDELLDSIKEGAICLVEGVQKNNLPDETLNKPAPRKYWKLWEEMSKPVKKSINPVLHSIFANQYGNPSIPA